MKANDRAGRSYAWRSSDRTARSVAGEFPDYGAGPTVRIRLPPATSQVLRNGRWDFKGALGKLDLESREQAFGIAAIDGFEIARVEPIFLEATNAIS